MLRRVTRVSATTTPMMAVRCISSYNFGQTSLDTEFIPRSQFKAPVPAVDEGVEVTVLGNGARLITHNKQGAIASVGIYAEAGAKYDPSYAPGLSYVMRWALMTSNFDNSIYQIDRTLRAHGAAFEHQEVRKRFVGWKVEARGDSWKKPAENLFTGMAVPRFPEFDISRFRDTMDNILEESRWQNPRQYTTDVLETIAFHREPLGSPRYVPSYTNDECSSEKLLAHWCRLFVPSRIVIAGVNVNHTDLLAAYENCPFQHSASAPHHASAGAVPALDILSEEKQYQGGREAFEQEKREKEMGTKPMMEKETIAAVGFRSFGRDLNIKQFASALTLQALADGITGDAIRYDRHASHLGIRSFYRPYSQAGLIGFTARNKPEKILGDIEEGVKLFRSLPLDAASVSAATQRAVTSFYHNELECGRDYLDFLASSLAPSGTQSVKADDIIKAILETKPADVERALNLVKAERPALFATGEVLGMPSLRQMGL